MKVFNVLVCELESHISPLVVILFRLKNIAYDVFQSYCYEITNTNYYPAQHTRRRGSSERIVSAIEIFLPHIGKIRGEYFFSIILL